MLGFMRIGRNKETALDLASYRRRLAAAKTPREALGPKPRIEREIFFEPVPQVRPKITHTMTLSSLLSVSGYASDHEIRSGLVELNGSIVVDPGAIVHPRTDMIRIDGHKIRDFRDCVSF